MVVRRRMLELLRSPEHNSFSSQNSNGDCDQIIIQHSDPIGAVTHDENCIYTRALATRPPVAVTGITAADESFTEGLELCEWIALRKKAELSLLVSINWSYVPQQPP